MTDQENTDSLSKERRSISGSISAKALEAMTPMIRETDRYLWSDAAFYKQVDRRRFGTFIVPDKRGGVVIIACDLFRLSAIHDPEGHATEFIWPADKTLPPAKRSVALKVHFPDGLLDAVRTRTATLYDENGGAFEVDVEPKAKRVLLDDGFGLVCIDHSEKWQQERFPGMIGTWFNGDHDNYIDGSSYRAEVADIAHIRELLSRSRESPHKSGSGIILNPEFLKSFASAAACLGVGLCFEFAGTDSAVHVYSSSDDRLFGLLMPLKPQGEHRDQPNGFRVSEMLDRIATEENDDPHSS